MMITFLEFCFVVLVEFVIMVLVLFIGTKTYGKRKVRKEEENFHPEPTRLTDVNEWGTIASGGSQEE